MVEPIVAFCTVAMNRLNHIRQTLPVNLEVNKSSSTQFVLLDYNSQDGLDEYVQSNFQNEIADNRLIYYQHKSAETFHRSHSRNMAFKLATADIVCNLDADNYTGPGFGKYLQRVFSCKMDVCLTGINNPVNTGATGKLCVSKDHFLQVTGYDEKFEGYGFEDFDIVNRLQLNGCETFTINNKEYLQAHSHEHTERICNESFYRSVQAVYVHYFDPHRSRLLYLLKDRKFITATIINKYTLNSELPDIAPTPGKYPQTQFEVENGWEQGEWSRQENQYLLKYNGESEVCHQVFTKSQSSLQSCSNTYFEVADTALKFNAIRFYTEHTNRSLMYSNLRSGKVKVNKCFGSGTVYKNFSDTPIEIAN